MTRSRIAQPPGVLRFLTDRNVLLFMTSNIAFSCGAYGLLIWLPSAIKTLGARDNLTIGILTAAPYVFAGAGAVYNSRRSDRTRERLWHSAVPSVVSGAALVLGFHFSGTVPVLGLLLLCVTGAGLYACLGPKWALMTEIVPGRSAGMALGLINGFGNIGGFGGPYAVGALRDATGSFGAGIAFLSACLALSGVLILFLRPGKTEPRLNP
jgi:ACS family tartrate transporter-like MFS transporter